MTKTRKAPWYGMAFAGSLLALAGFAAPAWANGGAFFAELMAEGMEDPDAGSPFFGFIKDQDGGNVPNALVTVTVSSGQLAVAARTDKLGHYRIPGFSKSIDATSVDVECSKPGYKQVSSYKRIMRRSADAPIQIDCIMARAEGGASS